MASSTRRKPLTDADLIEILNADDSEVYMSDEDHDEDDVPPVQTKKPNMFDEVMGNSEEMIAEEEKNSPNPTMSIPDHEAVPIELIDEFSQYVVTERKDIHFRRQFFASKTSFEPNRKIEEDFEEKATPMYYFSKFIPKEIYERLAIYTNIYAEQTGQSTQTFKRTCSDEMMKFVGIHLLMGTMKLPQIRMYWSKFLNRASISSVMSCDRFLQKTQ